MAERRMISKNIVDSDAFLDMPATSQNLYFHLNIRADDEGFIDGPKKIMRAIGANQNDLEILLSKRYLLSFDSGVIVIKHWKLHNLIRKDRMKETLYLEEKVSLYEKEDGSYTDHDNQVTTKCPRSIGKGSIGKDSKEDMDQAEEDFNLFWKAYPKKEGKKDSKKVYLSLYKKNTLPSITDHVATIEDWKKSDKWKGGFIPIPTTWLRGERWEDIIPEPQNRPAQNKPDKFNTGGMNFEL